MQACSASDDRGTCTSDTLAQTATGRRAPEAYWKGRLRGQIVGETAKGREPQEQEWKWEGLPQVLSLCPFSPFPHLPGTGQRRHLAAAGLFPKVRTAHPSFRPLAPWGEPSLRNGTGPGVHRSGGWNQLRLREWHPAPHADLGWFSLLDPLMKALRVGCHGYAAFNS